MTWATVWVFDVDFDPSLSPPLSTVGWALVGDDGHFTVGPFCNQDGSNVQNKKDIVIAVVPLSTAAQVLRYAILAQLGADPWTFYPYVYSAWVGQWNNQPDGTLDIGLRIVPVDSAVADAFRVYGLYSGVLAGWDLVANRLTPSYAGIPQVEVHLYAPQITLWFEIFGVKYLTAPGEPFPHYMVYGSACGWTQTSGSGPKSSDCAAHWDDFWWQIHIDSLASARSPFVLNHLYAHYATQRFFGGAYPSNGATPATSSRFAGDFDENAACSGNAPSYELYCDLRLTADSGNLDSVHPKEIAWAEGFADSFALRALATRPGGVETDVFAFNRPAGELWSFAFETKPASGSQQVEHAVAAALWDLTDSWTDGLDNYVGGFGRVWQAFTYARANTFREFWDNWRAALHSEVFPAREALAQNGFVTSRSTLNTPPASDAWANYVHICWTTTSPTDLSKIELYKSTTANFVPSTATLWMTITDTRTCQDVTGLSLGVTYYFELITYSLSAFPTNSNQVSATTHLPATIEGNVKNSGGSPIGGTGVVVTFPSGSTYTATTDANGYYTFTSNFLGTYRLKVAATGYVSYCMARVVSAYGTPYRFDFTISTATASIAPIYVTPAVQDASITVRDCYGTSVWSGRTDGTGKAAGITGLSHGTFTLDATWTDWSACQTGSTSAPVYMGSMTIEIPPNKSPSVWMAYHHSRPCPI